jgi:predicted acetyltransferase
MLALVLPSAQLEASFVESERELHALGVPPERLTLDADAFRIRLAQTVDAREGRIAPGKVASTTLWLADGDAYVGRISIRHGLNDSLRIIGGHIGYDVRPSRRGQGLGGQMLALALPHANALGIDPAMLTCDAVNLASWRMIERCGGTREAEYMHDGLLRYRYRLPTTR